MLRRQRDVVTQRLPYLCMDVQALPPWCRTVPAYWDTPGDALIADRGHPLNQIIYTGRYGRSLFTRPMAKVFVSRLGRGA